MCPQIYNEKGKHVNANHVGITPSSYIQLLHTSLDP